LAAGFFAAVLAGFAAALARVLLAVDRFADGFLFAVDFRAAGLRAVEDLAARAVPALAASVSVHLPDIARWTASVTASAISEPSLLALVMTALAACVALSAASRPASRMARRALGLALIAAAAAANPAASISRLIAALAILSTVVSDFLLEPDEDFLVPLAFAIADLLQHLLPKTLQSRNGSARAGNGCCADMLKGTAASRSDALRHGQRPKVTAVRSAINPREHPSPTSLLNHETSDHLLSLR
jgi:hypothetical protein